MKHSAAKAKPTELSRKMRAYMAEIYRLVDRQPADVDIVSSSQLAELVDVSPPAVNRMVNKLADLGLLHHVRYQGISITEAGRVAALKHIRYQRIAESFLTRIMDMNWLEVYEDSQRLSYGMSESVAQRMFEMAGKPQRCPHGEPIPDVNGKIPALDDLLLSELVAGDRARISRLITRESERLAYIEALGLMPDQAFEVIHVAPFMGPMQLKLDREYRIIGNSLAGLIRAERMA